MIRTNNRKPLVSASEVGMAAFCGRAVYLKRTKAEVSRKAVERMSHGHARHEDLNSLVKNDQRCFVASYLYGMDDQRTYRLRAWRDQRLKVTKVGRMLVNVYYKLSPVLVELCKRHPKVEQTATLILDWLSLRIEEIMLRKDK